MTGADKHLAEFFQEHKRGHNDQSFLYPESSDLNLFTLQAQIDQKNHGAHQKEMPQFIPEWNFVYHAEETLRETYVFGENNCCQEQKE